MHYYKFNIGDYLSHTGHLTLLEDLAYRRLIDYQFLNECHIPSDIKQAARVIRMNDCLTDVEQVLNEFYSLDEDGWLNNRVQRELNEYHAKALNASKAGKASAKARKAKRKQQVPKSNDRSTDAQRTCNQTLTINHKPITINNSKEAFDIFYDNYPKKKNKGAAEKAWKKIKPEQYQPIMDALANACNSDDWTKDKGKWIPYPASWLNAKGWEDEETITDKPKYEPVKQPSLMEQMKRDEAARANNGQA
jgi:uncharacterized protein YdaU (DUF1376 family)